jgi:hypothetical protein
MPPAQEELYGGWAVIAIPWLSFKNITKCPDASATARLYHESIVAKPKQRVLSPARSDEDALNRPSGLIDSVLFDLCLDGGPAREGIWGKPRVRMWFNLGRATCKTATAVASPCSGEWASLPGDSLCQSDSSHASAFRKLGHSRKLGAQLRSSRVERRRPASRQHRSRSRGAVCE